MTDALERLMRAASDDSTLRKRQTQWRDAAWADRQVADGTFREMAAMDAVEIARRDDEFAVKLLDALKALRSGKRGGVTQPRHVRQLEVDLVTIYRRLFAQQRAGLVERRAGISEPLYPRRASEKSNVRVVNLARKAELAEIDKQIAFIDRLDPVVVVAAKLHKKGGGKLAGATLKRRNLPR
jgi:hypothetical protein